MKKLLILLLFCVLPFSACSSSSVGIIGGADGPTHIIVDENNGTAKAPVRMVRLNGELYYSSGNNSEIDARCGVMDGKIKGGAEESCIPTEDNTSNFDGEYSYQLCSGNTIELLMDGEWIVFDKIIADRDISGYTYCFCLKGTMPNAAKESELIAMTHDKELSFEQAAKSIYSSLIDDHIDIFFISMK